MIAPDTLAKLVRAQGEARKAIPSEPVSEASIPQDYIPQDYAAQDYASQDYIETPMVPAPPTPSPASAPRRKPRPIQKGAAQAKSPDRAPAPRKAVAKAVGKMATGKPQSIQSKPQGKTAGKTVSKPSNSKLANKASTARNSQRDAITVQPKPLPKLFTEQTGDYRHSALSSDEEKEIGGIWLALSIILIIVTAFGAGFLIMKPLLNDR